MLVTVAAVVAQFMGWCERHRSKATVRSYGGYLKRLDRDFGGREWADVKPLEIDEWLDRQAKRADGSRVAPDTERLAVVSFERLQGWAVEHKVVEGPILLNRLEKPKGRQRERIPTKAETETILAHSSPEFRMAYQALRYCGARPAEICAAQIDDLDPALGAIVLAKHKTARKVGKPRVIPVGQKLSEIITAAIGGRTSGPIFLDERGKQWTPGKLSRIYKIIRDKHGLPKDLVLYLVRHEHGTEMTKRFGIHAAAVALGHASISTTQRYAHLTTDEQRTNQDALDL